MFGLLFSEHDIADAYIYQLTVTTVVCVRLAQDRAIQNSSMDRGRASKAPPLGKELLAVDGC